ncbi:MAG TPA: magnesium/cobalt transporter CorA [Mycobacteriales bacterium]|jgi:magnesium transporter|nr:magnesium/cobalt transporter CorA [Mycobacteriales bacterium]
MQTRVYRKGVLEAEGFDPGDVSEYLDQPDTFVWLDVCRPTAEDLAVVADELGLHPLAREDATGHAQRPKLEPYAGHQFLVSYGVDYDGASRRIRTSEIDVFFDERWVLTVRKEPVFDLDRVLRRWDDSPELAKHGVAYLIYGLLDVIVDGHFTVVEQLDEAIEDLEERLFKDDTDPYTVQRETFELRKALVAFRRVVLPMREVVNSLLRRDVCEIGDELAPYFQDVYDHVLRATEWTESLRDLVTSVLETQLTIQGNRLNEVMKRLTSYAAIVAVPTAIAGVYGMNTRLYPAAGTVAGWWVAMVLMVGISAVLFVYFRRKDWL